MKRLLWLGIGIAVGALVAQQVTKRVRAYAPSNLAGNLAGSARDGAAGLFDSVRDFLADVREGMADREAEIHDAFEQGVALDDQPELFDDLSDDRDRDLFTEFDGARVRR